MDTISGFLNNDHIRCDLLCNEVESAVGTERWDRADVVFKEFCVAMEQHFAMEEDVLFVAFEKAIHRTDGPTSVMRDEHNKIRSVIFMLHDALARRARNAFLGHADTLNIMIEQHNQVEESVFYPMIDHLLEAKKHEIIEAMKQNAAPQSDPN